MIEQLLLVLPLIFGAYISISLMKLPDLSLESAYLFGAALSAEFGCLGGLIGGALVGTFSSTINQACKVPFLLATIIANGLFHAISQYTMKGGMLSINSTLGFTPLVALSAILVVVLFIVLRSEFGHALAIFGDNPHFFKGHKIAHSYVVMGGVILANACAGLSGYLFAQFNGFIDLTMGNGVVLLGITAIMIGKTLFKGFLIPIAGLIGYFILMQLLLLLGFDLKYFNGLQAISILGLYLSFQKKEARHERNPASI